MNRNVLIGIVVALALVVVGWWYWAMMMPEQALPEDAAAGESVNGVAEADEDAAVELAGTWQSTQDSRFVRAFAANGTVTDRYEGDDSATVIGTWNFVADPSKEQAELPVIKDAKVIKVQFPEEVMYFAITNLTATNLSMIYVGGNGSLEFRRI